MNATRKGEYLFPSGSLRLILRSNIVEVHFAVEAIKQKRCTEENTLGLDKGYTGVFYGSDGKKYGEGFGKLLSNFSNKINNKNRYRNKLFSLVKNDSKKANNIKKNNLGKKKQSFFKKRHKSKVKTFIHNAVNQVFDNASKVIVEDLTAPIKSKKYYSKSTKRKLNAWTKGLIAEALNNVSHRRGSMVIMVNPAYTSQIDSRYGVLMGQRKGESFYCFDGEVLHADHNAALNILARSKDSEIDQLTSYKEVSKILLKRTEQFRLRLSNQDTSCCGYIPCNVCPHNQQ